MMVRTTKHWWRAGCFACVANGSSREKAARPMTIYVTHLANGVHAIALTSDQQVVMVRQFRAGSRRDSLETPGGLLDPGEDPCAAGARELLEETGYAGDPPELLGTIWPIPALLSMRISTVVIRNARLVAEPHLDQTEEVALELVPVEDIPALIKSGQIDHGVCVAGLLWWLMLHGTEITQELLMPPLVTPLTASIDP